MTLADLGNLGEFVAAIAVVGSLIYLATQIRQNSKLLRASAIQSVASSTAESLSTIAQDLNTAGVLARGLGDFKSLSLEEAAQCSALFYLIFNEIQSSYRMHREKVIPEELWQSKVAVATFYLRTPGVREWWKAGRELMERDFVRYAERELPAEQASN
jgi:uncharacterized membrane protein